MSKNNHWNWSMAKRTIDIISYIDFTQFKILDG